MRRALIAVPAAALLGVQIALFVALSGRGLDLTDESYYLLNYQHWQGFTAQVTFFGAYFALPFRWLGGDVAAMRVFGLLLLLASGAVFTWRAMVFGRDPRQAMPLPWLYIAPGMTGALFYFSYLTTLRLPSYNLVVVVCALLSSALLLVLADGAGSRLRLALMAFAYGVVLGACALNKATSALALALCHVVFLLCFARLNRLPEWAVLALLGVGLNLVGLQLAQPHWLDVLREGVQLTTLLDSRHTAMPFAGHWDAVLRGAVRVLPVLAVAGLLFVGVVRRWGRSHRAVLSTGVLLLVGGLMVTIQWPGYGKWWWVLVLFGTSLLWLAERLCRDQQLPRWRDVRAGVGLSVLLFALPICGSMGTNNDLPSHTQIAAVFGVVALMLPLRRLHTLGLIHGVALSVALAMLGLPVLAAQWRALSDPAFTYRLRTGLLDQDTVITLGPQARPLRLDGATRDSLVASRRQLAEAGFRAGDPMLDATGDSPGLVYALGGRPLGVAWLIGGYPGSERVAARVLDGVPVAELRRAWVLTGDGQPRALRGLLSALRQRTGEPGPEALFSFEYEAPYRQAGAGSVPPRLTLWRPAMPNLGAASSPG